MSSRDVSRLAMVLNEEEERIREIELKTAAAIVIQSFWRKVAFLLKQSVNLHDRFKKRKPYCISDLYWTKGNGR